MSDKFADCEVWHSSKWSKVTTVKFTAIWVMEYREIGASQIEKLSSWTGSDQL